MQIYNIPLRKYHSYVGWKIKNRRGHSRGGVFHVVWITKSYGIYGSMKLRHHESSPSGLQQHESVRPSFTVARVLSTVLTQHASSSSRQPKKYPSYILQENNNISARIHNDRVKIQKAKIVKYKRSIEILKFNWRRVKYINMCL